MTQQLLPDQLRDLWQSIEAKARPADDYERMKDEWFGQYKAEWKQSLILPGQPNLKKGLLFELAQYLKLSPADVERRCKNASGEITKEWDASVREEDRASVEAFYNKSAAEIYGLLWWHTLEDDLTPLSYLAARKFAIDRRCKRYLDFGSGVGSGALLFRHAGFAATCADISSPMLNFCQFRFELRNWPGKFIDLKQQQLPAMEYDFITAMDVFEHLFDPMEAAERLINALKPGGYLMGRWAIEEHDHRRGHIVKDLRPTIARMKDLGMSEVWRDDWLWGHQVFQKK
jgi:SAM-dependent methyltransferase